METQLRCPVMTTAGLIGTSMAIVQQVATASLPRDQRDFRPVLMGLPQGPLWKAELGRDNKDIYAKFTVATRRPFAPEPLRQDEVPDIIADPEFFLHLRLLTLPGEMLFFEKKAKPGAPPKKKSRRKYDYHLSIFPTLDVDIPAHMRLGTDVAAYARLGCPWCRSHGGAQDFRRGWLEPVDPAAPMPEAKPFTAGDFAADLLRFDRAQAEERFPFQITREDYAALLIASAELLKAVPIGRYLRPASGPRMPP